MSYARNNLLAAGPSLFVAIFFICQYLGQSVEFSAAAGTAIWMLTWWVSEAVAFGVTAFVPLITFPLFNVLSIKRATQAYSNPVVFLFLGGFILAIALEKHRLHERIALKIIAATGSTANGIILGFSLATALMSMWISNTAAAMMMMPVAASVVALTKRDPNFATALMLSVAYSASIGGMATLIGSPPNMIAAGLYQERYQTELTFLEWTKFGLPTAIVLLAVCYIFLTRVLYPSEKSEVGGAGKLLDREISELGPRTSAQRRILYVFGLVALLWVLRPLLHSLIIGILPNTWAKLTLFDDTTIALIGGLLMFTLTSGPGDRSPILTWEDARCLPWGILLLFGSGLCLADGLETVGVVKLIGQVLSGQGNLSLWALLLLFTAIAIFLTELLSNVALATVMVPIMFGIADTRGLDPLLLAIAITLGASCGFALPISTPPNAILYSSGHIKMKQIVTAGTILNLLAAGVICAVVYAVGH
jgi:sodium-dependent dicarboxylate transporter 2/3/5